MAKFPEPPDAAATLARIAPLTLTLDRGTRLARIYFMGGEHPGRWNGFRHFGPTASRWDHHLRDARGRPVTQSRGVLYAAAGPEAIPTCLAEVFPQRRIVELQVGRPALVGFELAAPLTLLDLTGRFPTRLGASTAMHSGPRPKARRWSRALYDAYPTVQGLLYRSSTYGNAPAVALYERAIDALPAEPHLHRLLDDPALSRTIRIAAAECGYQVTSAPLERPRPRPAR